MIKTSLVICLIALAVGLPSLQAKRAPFLQRAAYKGRIGAKSLDQMDRMIACTTGLDFINVAYEYIGYGCWCGKGGNGTPKDDTDQCCYEHDKCYDRSPCASLLTYTIPYKYDRVDCETAQASITCTAADDYPWYYGDQNECAAFICECDKEIALCVQQRRGTYNTNYRGWDNDLC